MVLLASSNLVVAASPVERLPSQKKTRRGNILRKNLHIIDPLIAHLETQVRDVFGLRETPVILGLLFFQTRLPIFGAVCQSFLAG